MIVMAQKPTTDWQNRLVVNLMGKYVVIDLGQRKDGKGGKRVIVFVGYSQRNYDVFKALKEQAKGYWDDVRLVEYKD